MNAAQPEPPESAESPEPAEPGDHGGPPAAEEAIDDYSARVLDLVDAIPPGQVMSYGDIAEYLGDGGPRQVGRVMSRYGGGAPWWRVIHSDGTVAPGHDAQALRHYIAEHTPLRSAVRPVRVDMREARWRGPAGPVPGDRGLAGEKLAERGLAPPGPARHDRCGRAAGTGRTGPGMSGPRGGIGTDERLPARPP